MSKRKREPKGLVTKRKTRQIERSIRKNSYQSIRRLTNELGINASETTVWRTLRKIKYNSKRAKVSPPLRQKHKKERIDFALKHLSGRMDWRSVFFFG